MNEKFGYFLLLFFVSFDLALCSIQDYYCGSKNCYKILNVTKYKKNTANLSVIFKGMQLLKTLKNHFDPWPKSTIPTKVGPKE